MFFIYIMRWIKWWYHRVVFPTMTTPFTYALLLLWMLIIATITYLFFAKIDRHRMQYMYKNAAVAICKSAGFGLLMATMFIALYNLALNLTASSEFFRFYEAGTMELATHMPWQTAISNLMERRILIVLFLMFGSALSLNFVASCCYQLEDDKNWWIYAASVATGSVVCYLLCMAAGYV